MSASHCHIATLPHCHFAISCPVEGEGLYWVSRLCVVVVQGDAGEGVGGVGGAAVLHCTVVLCGVVGWKWGISYLDFISISDPVSCHSC